MNPWRLRPITDKQKKYIDEMQNYSPYPLPKFEGKTRGEAADYIDKYGKLAHESEWAIQNNISTNVSVDGSDMLLFNGSNMTK